MTTVLLVAPVLHLRRNRLLPPGALTVLVATVAFPAALLTELEFWAPAAAAVTATAVLDAGLAFAPTLSDSAVAVLVPVTVWGGQLAGLAASGELRWPPELWTGVVVLSSMAALGLARLLGPHPVDAATQSPRVSAEQIRRPRHLVRPQV